jgi:hypothetical protein
MTLRNKDRLHHNNLNLSPSKDIEDTVQVPANRTGAKKNWCLLFNTCVILMQGPC